MSAQAIEEVLVSFAKHNLNLKKVCKSVINYGHKILSEAITIALLAQYGVQQIKPQMKSLSFKSILI
jgi:hypothetical protein